MSIVIPRTTQSQYGFFHRETRPGDLVFFGGSDANHVGIFEGGAMMVAAATALEGIRYQRIYSDSTAFGTITH